MKTKERALNRGPHPAANWIFPLLGILITALLMSYSSSFHVLMFFVLSGPFFLLGLACVICCKSAATRMLGFKLTVIQFSISLFSYFLIFALAWLSACGALGMALSAFAFIWRYIFVFTWLFAIVSFFVLLSKAASGETPENAVPEPLQNPSGEQSDTAQERSS